MFDRVRINWLVTGCVAVLLLTVFAGVLQYRWINRASDAHRRQGREAMEGTLRNFSGDFRDTLLRLPPFFRPPPDERNDAAFEPYMIEMTRRWHSNSDRPQLLASISIGTQSGKGVVFRRLQTGDNQFKAEDWPNEFVVYRRVLEERLRLPGGQPPLFPNGFAFEFFQGRPVLIFPLVTGAPPTPEWQRPGGQSRRFPAPLNTDTMNESPPSQQPLEPRDLLQSLSPAPPQGSVHVPELRGWCFLEVDNDYLRQYLLPELVARNYGTGARYQVAVVASYPLSMIYGSDPTLTIGSLSQVDAGIVLLDANLPQGRQGPPPPRPGPQPFVSGPQGVSLAELGGNRGGTDDRDWLLVVKNKSGSIEALVENARRHTLGFSFIMLVLLAGSSVMLMLAMVRARRLAQLQMEFVAGVSHELRTPLTVIQSTSYNLSQGTIRDPNRVQQYGDVIQREARRLINQIERMLSFAGIQSGRRVYDPQPTNVTEIAERSLAEYAVPFAEDGWQIEQHFAEDLPLVLTDGPALESALKNLFENALKYASRGKWLSVSACASQDTKRREVQITVADRGPGIAPKDLPHIFEPFYRGQSVNATTTSGAGLGLCLVERNLRALDGSVTVQSAPGDGTSFTLHLPVS
ncbi:MAG: HAMP domain-containing histidine kinase [Acidobacteriota bacterium]|nr:HAMP domain-containing histidine kinase [Acidobacteriota bacterium]